MLCPSYTNFRHVFATSATAAADGYEVWPSASVRDGGFDGGFTMSPRPITAFPITITTTGFAVPCHWYVSQRTDDAAGQYLSVTGGTGASVTIALTAVATTALGLSLTTSPVTPDQVQEILNNCWVYVQRVSDDAIQWCDLLTLASQQ